MLSPDGRWLTYVSDQSGRNEVYVRPFVAPGTTAASDDAQWQVSTSGGIHPAWRRDGKELFYLDPSGAMMGLPVTAAGNTFDPGPPTLLFPTRIYGGGVDSQQGRNYDVAPDGLFLINSELTNSASPITLIQNWTPEGTR
jgi:hypothetical protein